MVKQFIEALNDACNNSIHSISMHRAFYIALTVLGKKAINKEALDEAWLLIRAACFHGDFVITPPNCFGKRFIVEK